MPTSCLIMYGGCGAAYLSFVVNILLSVKCERACERGSSKLAAGPTIEPPAPPATSPPPKAKRCQTFDTRHVGPTRGGGSSGFGIGIFSSRIQFSSSPSPIFWLERASACAVCSEAGCAVAVQFKFIPQIISPNTFGLWLWLPLPRQFPLPKWHLN